MNKREYFRDRKKLIKAYEKGEMAYGEFIVSMAALAQEFKPRWGNEISSTGKILGSKLMETTQCPYCKQERVSDGQYYCVNCKDKHFRTKEGQ